MTDPSTRRSGTHPTRRSVLGAGLTAGGLLATAGALPRLTRRVAAQGTTSTGVQPDGSTRSVWRIGGEVTSTDAIRALVLSFPIPMDWPDQSVTELDREEQPPGIRTRESVVGGGVRLLTVTAPLVSPDTPCRVVGTYECVHPAPAPPEDPDGLVIPSARAMREFLGKSPGIETDDRTVRAAADEAISVADARSTPPWRVARTIYDWVRGHVDYKFDPTLRGAAAAVASHVGDCEELTSLFIAICRLRGIPARSVWIPGHTYPEFCLADGDGAARWYACQAAGSEAFGHVSDPRPILQKGDSFVVPGGGPKPVRYVAAVLQARDIGRTVPSLKMIAEPVPAGEAAASGDDGGIRPNAPVTRPGTLPR